jgi:hypothetical protein
MGDYVLTVFTVITVFTLEPERNTIDDVDCK